MIADKEKQSSHYHDHADMEALTDLKELAPEEYEAWRRLNSVVGRDDGKIPRKYRELIALAVATTTQCVYCIDAHVKAARKAGATRGEVAEATLLAAALRAGAGAAHGAVAMKLYEDAEG